MRMLLLLTISTKTIFSITLNCNFMDISIIALQMPLYVTHIVRLFFSLTIINGKSSCWYLYKDFLSILEIFFLVLLLTIEQLSFISRLFLFIRVIIIDFIDKNTCLKFFSLKEKMNFSLKFLK